LLIGCSTEGDLTIHNDSGPYLEVRVDGAAFLLDDGETVTKRIDLGRKFLFGPDEKAVSIRGEGECKLPFNDMVLVNDERTVLYTVFGDAGYIDICNQTGYTIELYLSPCADASWGEPLELVPDGYCTYWMLERGCWDMLAVTIEGDFEEYNILISPCETEAYDLIAASLTKGDKSTGLKMAPGRTGTKELRKVNKGVRAIE
jgi:hypothetical protein